MKKFGFGLVLLLALVAVAVASHFLFPHSAGVVLAGFVPMMPMVGGRRLLNRMPLDNAAMNLNRRYLGPGR